MSTVQPARSKQSTRASSRCAAWLRRAAAALCSPDGRGGRAASRAETARCQGIVALVRLVRSANADTDSIVYEGEHGIEPRRAGTIQASAYRLGYEEAHMW